MIKFKQKSTMRNVLIFLALSFSMPAVGQLFPLHQGNNPIELKRK